MRGQRDRRGERGKAQSQRDWDTDRATEPSGAGAVMGHTEAETGVAVIPRATMLGVTCLLRASSALRSPVSILAALSSDSEQKF